MNKKTVLFVDIDDNDIPSHNYRAPHFAAARRMGLDCLVVATKGRKNIDRLFVDSDEVFFLDKISEASLLELIDKINVKYNLNAIFCHADPTSTASGVVDIIARICQKLDFLCSPAAALIACNNKFLMREKLKQHNIRSTHYALCHDIKSLLKQAENIGYPLIFKPPFGACSAFVTKCHHQDECVLPVSMFESY